MAVKRASSLSGGGGGSYRYRFSNKEVSVACQVQGESIRLELKELGDNDRQIVFNAPGRWEAWLRKGRQPQA